MIRILKSLTIVSTVGMLFILIGGALVTKTDSGMGCGSSWPLCNGQLFPSEITPELIIEYSHRLVSTVIGVSVLIVAILAWNFLGHIREIKFLAFLSTFFLILQGLIGAAAVTWPQSDFVLAAHFGISLISFAAVFLLMLLVFEVDKKLDTNDLHIHKKHRFHIYGLTIFTMFVVYTGALVRHADANLVCGDWPFCSNAQPFAFFDYTFTQWIQMGHRLFAAILLIWTLYFFVIVFKNYRSNFVMYWGWVCTSLLIISQIVLGALIIFTLLNLAVSLFHALVITCYFGILTYFVLLSSRSAAAEKDTVQNTSSDEKPVLRTDP